MKVLIILILALLIALVLVGGTRKPLGPVGDRSVVYWTPSAEPCPEGQEYITQINKGGIYNDDGTAAWFDGWEDLRIPTLARPDPYYQMGECVAFAKGTTAAFRACCSNGGNCEVATISGLATNCTAIYEMKSGRRFQQAWVDLWNSAHGGGG